MILPDDELNQLVAGHFLSIKAICRADNFVYHSTLCNSFTDDRVSDEWNLRYGRSLAMQEALGAAFDRVVTAENRDKWMDTVVSHSSSDRVRIQ